MARKYIKGWAKARKEAIERSGGICAKCGQDIIAIGEKIEVNHITALVDGGDETDQGNLEVLCKSTCHRPHTIEVVRRIAKQKRIKAKHEGTAKERKNKRKLQSRPMSNSYSPFNPKNRNRPVSERGKMR